MRNTKFCFPYGEIELLNYLPKECYATEDITFSDNNKTIGNLLAGRNTLGVAIGDDNLHVSEVVASERASKVENQQAPSSGFVAAKKKIEQAKNLAADIENAV